MGSNASTTSTSSSSCRCQWLLLAIPIVPIFCFFVTSLGTGRQFTPSWFQWCAPMPTLCCHSLNTTKKTEATWTWTNNNIGLRVWQTNFLQINFINRATRNNGDILGGMKETSGSPLFVSRPEEVAVLLFSSPWDCGLMLEPRERWHNTRVFAVGWLDHQQDGLSYPLSMVFVFVSLLLPLLVQIALRL